MALAAPAPVRQVVNSAPALDTETSTADLGLVDVKLIVEQATALAGPAYSLKFSNQGLAATSKFTAAAIMSDDGTATAESPKAAVEVPECQLARHGEITLRLPRGESKFLVLALDMNDDVTEFDK